MTLVFDEEATGFDSDLMVVRWFGRDGDVDVECQVGAETLTRYVSGW